MASGQIELHIGGRGREGVNLLECCTFSDFSCFAQTDVVGHPHRSEDRDDNKIALRSKPSCSSVHAGAPDPPA